MSFRIIVCVKQVLDTRVPLEIVDAGLSVRQKSPAPVCVVNPADRCALDEGVRLVDELDATLVAVTVGPSRARSALRYCLARGAHSAIHIAHEDSTEFDAGSAAVVVANAIRGEPFDMVLCGEVSLDDHAAQFGPALAELLGLPQVTRAVEIDVALPARQLTAQRLLERGDRQVLACPLPALVTVSRSIGDPHYVPIRAQKMVAEERIVTLEANALMVSGPSQAGAAPMARVTRFALPRLRPKRIFSPDSSLSSAERIRLLSGGASQRGSAQVKASPEEAAEQIIGFLRQHGILGSQ